MKYYRLTDKLNLNEVVKDDNGKRYTYRFGAEEWVPSGIMVRYMWPEDSKFAQYALISEEKALQLLDEQRSNLERLLELAIKVATKAHESHLDKDGKPHILYLQTLAASLDNIENKIVAYLYDIIEDTEITLDDLEKMGFTYRIVNSIRILTKSDDISYDDYLKSVKKDSNAWHVKMADIKHNIKKYEKALAFLEN